MLALGAAPNASILRPVKLGANLHQLLIADAELERDLVELYSQATRYCARNNDHDNRKFFEDLLKEEQAHDIALVEWIKNLESPGTSHSTRVTF